MTSAGLPEFYPSAGLGTTTDDWDRLFHACVMARERGSLSEAICLLAEGKAKVVSNDVGPLIETPPLVPPDETSV